MTGSTTRVGSMFGRYRIRELLGRGGMGEVYEAYDTVKDRIVALKILSDEHFGDHTFRERFRRESHAAARLQEPHIVPIHDWGDVDGTLYIDMRRVNGVDLRALLDRGPLDPARAVEITGQVAAALDAAHNAGLVHRDVKPGNIIVTPADFAYLVDFGIAESAGDTRLTSAGTAIGSLAYMAPERFDDQPVTRSADVYSLACVLYEMLTGSVPYPTTNLQHLIAAHVSTPPPRPSAANPAVPPGFDAVIARGLAKQPSARYPTAAALRAAAEHALHAVPRPGAGVVETRPAYYPPVGTAPAGYPPVQPTGGRPRWALGAAAGAAATALIGGALVVVAVVLLQHDRETADPAAPPTVAAGVTSVPTAKPAPKPSPTVMLPPGARVCPAHVPAGGAYTTSAIGTSVTSCEFAEAVRAALGRGRPVGSTPQVVRAYSPVTKKWYPMTCVANGPVTTCTGGNDAIVYVY